MQRSYTAPHPFSFRKFLYGSRGTRSCLNIGAMSGSVQGEKLRRLGLLILFKQSPNFIILFLRPPVNRGIQSGWSWFPSLLQTTSAARNDLSIPAALPDGPPPSSYQLRVAGQLQPGLDQAAVLLPSQTPSHTPPSPMAWTANSMFSMAAAAVNLEFVGNPLNSSGIGTYYDQCSGLLQQPPPRAIRDNPAHGLPGRLW